MEYGIKAITSSLNRQTQAPPEFRNAAAMGRNGDDTIAHLDSGEVVIPKHLQSPGLMALFAKNARGQNTDPQRYVVGSKHNSINPNTGLQEFWGGVGGNAEAGGMGVGGPSGSPGSGSPGAGPDNGGGVLGTQSEFDSAQANNPMGTANARAMGWGNINSDPTPASMYDLDLMAFDNPDDVAANYGYAPTANQNLKSFWGSLFGSIIGLKTEPDLFATDIDAVTTSWNPLSFASSLVLSPAANLATSIIGHISDTNIDQALGTRVTLSGNPKPAKSFSDGLDTALGNVSDAFGILGDGLASAPGVLGDALAGDIGISLGDPNAEGQTDNPDRGPSDTEIILTGDVSPQILFDASPIESGIEAFAPGTFAPGQLLADGSSLPNYLDFFDVDADGNVTIKEEHKDLLDQYIYRNLPSLMA